MIPIHFFRIFAFSIFLFILLLLSAFTQRKDLRLNMVTKAECLVGLKTLSPTFIFQNFEPLYFFERIADFAPNQYSFTCIRESVESWGYFWRGRLLH